MPGLGIQISVSADELAAAASDALDTQLAWGLHGAGSEHFTEFSIATLGSLLITSGRTTPVALRYGQGEKVTVEMCYSGPSRFREGQTDLHTAGGEILVFPNSGGILCGGGYTPEFPSRWINNGCSDAGMRLQAAISAWSWKHPMC